MSPKPQDKYFKKGEGFFKQGKSLEAIEEFKKSIKKNPTFKDPYIGIGVCFHGMQDYLKALEWLDKASEIDPDDADILFYRGFSLKKLNRFNDAIDSLDKYLHLDPTDRSALILKGQSLYALGRMDEAVENYDKILSDSKKRFDHNYKLALQCKIQALKALGKTEDIKETQKNQIQILREYPEMIGIREISIPNWINKGLRFYSLGKVEKLTLNDTITKMNAVLGIYQIRPETAKMFAINQQLILAEEITPDAWKVFQKTTNIQPLDIVNKKT
ncbi:MAG: tetratricopeptide repeat protein [Candidatus Hodarchaeales archaeon]|jgi:tetratricopeptide (TPR) repeat protein